MRELSVSQLLAQYRQILAELRRRGVIRTNNAPTGDYAEWLTAQLMRGELAPNSEKSFDVSAPDGRRFQVKARVSPAEGDRGTRQLSAFRSWDFDDVVIILFEDDYSIRRAVQMPAEAMREAATYVAHTNSYRVIATDELLDMGRDITADIRRLLSQGGPTTLRSEGPD